MGLQRFAISSELCLPNKEIPPCCNPLKTRERVLIASKYRGLVWTPLPFGEIRVTTAPIRFTDVFKTCSKRSHIAFMCFPLSFGHGSRRFENRHLNRQCVAFPLSLITRFLSRGEWFVRHGDERNTLPPLFCIECRDTE